VRTPAIITEGDSPDAQRVVYGTDDGRIHFRALGTGAQVAPAVSVVDSALTDPTLAFGPGVAFAAGSGVVFAVHDDGAGVDIARLDARAGTRLGPDVPVPDSLGCTVGGSPLLTPPATDGSRLLFFTLVGTCPRGSSLVRVPVGPDGRLGGVTSGATAGLVAGVAPALIVVGSPPQFVVAVARSGGLDLRRADADLARPPEGFVDTGEDPGALAAPDTAPLPTPSLVVLTRVGDGTRVVRLDQAADGTLHPAPGRVLTGTPVGLAIAGADSSLLAVSTSAGLSVLRAADLSLVGTADGGAGAVSAAGDLAFAVRDGRLLALRLDHATVEELGRAPAVPYAPALARGFVTLGPDTVRTTDVTVPGVAMPADSRGLTRLSAIVSDDRGVAGVEWRLDRQPLRVAEQPVSGSPFEPGARYEAAFNPRQIAPGAYKLWAIARDGAGNVGRARRPVNVRCDHVRRGGRRGEVLRGRRGRDCLHAGGGNDRVFARDGSPDALYCGSGRDRVRADRYDHVAGDCERVRRSRP
jgi:hypothetical protein